ncbi:MAG: hypothetical protein OHK0039_05870 [Bacteroidia bacterium]
MDKTHEDIHHLIGDYLLDRLPPDQRAAVDARLAIDLAFATELDRQQTELAALHVLAHKDLRAVAGQSLDAHLGYRRRMVAALGVAAAILLLLGSLAWWQSARLPDYPALAARYLEAPVLRSTRSDAADAGWQAFRQVLATEDYPQAAQLLQGMLADTAFVARDVAALCLGYCYQMQGAYGPAREAYGQVGHLSLYAPEAQWYIALSYLQASDLERARALLHVISEDPAHPRQALAADVLGTLHR